MYEKKDNEEPHIINKYYSKCEALCQPCYFVLTCVARPFALPRRIYSTYFIWKYTVDRVESESKCVRMFL